MAQELSPLERACQDYLNSKPFVLYADFDISKADRRVAAAKWLANEVRQVHEVLA